MHAEPPRKASRGPARQWHRRKRSAVTYPCLRKWLSEWAPTSRLRLGSTAAFLWLDAENRALSLAVEPCLRSSLVRSFAKARLPVVKLFNLRASEALDVFMHEGGLGAGEEGRVQLGLMTIWRAFLGYGGCRGGICSGSTPSSREGDQARDDGALGGI
ncbi:hypothetical protein MKX08_005393 [Trichoderma sp. CBMAI-0020]|nr:hypothetical protein MKX08_005393 [Trichoderma sp. CBMAI-0020]